METSEVLSVRQSIHTKTINNRMARQSLQEIGAIEMRILDMKTETVELFPGSQPLVLQTFAPDTPFDRELRKRFSFPPPLEEKDEDAKPEKLKWRYGVKEEGGETLKIIEFSIESDRVRVEVAGDHSVCDGVMADLRALLTKYSPNKLLWEDSLKLPSTNVKVQFDFDTRCYFDNKFLTFVSSLGKSVYDDKRLSVYVQPYFLNVALVARSNVAQSSLVGRERAVMNTLTGSLLSLRISVSTAAEFESGMMTLDGPVRSEVFVPFLEDLQRTYKK